MKFAIFLIFVATATLVASRPSKSEALSPESESVHGDASANMELQRSKKTLFFSRSKIHRISLNMETPLVNIALGTSSIHSRPSYLHRHDLNDFGSHSEVHSSSSSSSSYSSHSESHSYSSNI